MSCSSAVSSLDSKAACDDEESSVEGGAVAPIGDHPVCSSSGANSDDDEDDDDLTVDVTSIEDVTVAASEGEGCSTPCPAAASAEFMTEDCQDEPDQVDTTGFGQHEGDSDEQRCPLDEVPCPAAADGVSDSEVVRPTQEDDDDAPCSADHEVVPCPASSTDIGVECQIAESPTTAVSCPAEDDKTIAEDEEEDCGGWVKMEESTLPKEHAAGTERVQEPKQEEAAKEEKKESERGSDVDDRE